MHAMRLYLINPSNPLVSSVKVKESRWNRYRVWKPLSLMVLAGLTPPDWEISIIDENLGLPDYPAMPRPDLVGITEINPLWIYSRRGEIFHENWAEWGAEIELSHKYAVVFATEMALDLVGTAPHSPTTIASMGNYAQGAYVATQLAGFIAPSGKPQQVVPFNIDGRPAQFCRKPCEFFNRGPSFGIAAAGKFG